MRRSIALLVMTFASLAPADPAAYAGPVCGRTISIENSSYSPATASRVASSDLIVVCWYNEDDADHSATSNRGMFDTGIIVGGGQADETFYGSGAYGYHCVVHPVMAGTFKIRPAVSDASISLGDSLTLTVGPSGLIKAAPTWDVQRRRNDGPWVQFKTATTDPTIDTRPGRAGTFRYRARTHVSGNLSGWSPVRIVTVSEN